MTAEEIVNLLGLQRHPKEGGFFAETYRADESIAQAALPGRYSGARSHGTAIYYLLAPGSLSPMHRLKSDEVFHFYMGDPVEMLQLGPGGASRKFLLGTDLASGARPQALAPKNVWQGARLKPGGSFALIGCTVAPGFDYSDYEHGARAELLREYPDYAETILELTEA